MHTFTHSISQRFVHTRMSNALRHITKSKSNIRRHKSIPHDQSNTSRKEDSHNTSLLSTNMELKPKKQSSCEIINKMKQEVKMIN